MKRLITVVAIGGLIGALLLAAAAFGAVFMSLAAGPPGDPWGDALSRLSGQLFALSRMFVLVGAIGGAAYLALYVDWGAGEKKPTPRHSENDLLD
jgi:hypothetical protein